MVNDQPSSVLAESGASNMIYIWGQFLDHAINLSEPNTNPADVDNIVDPTCAMDLCQIPFTRSEHTIFEGRREHLNLVTSFVDASMVYGSDRERVDELQEFLAGLLKVSADNLLPFNVNGLHNGALPTNDPTRLFLAGDIHANEQIGLKAIHTLFVREHNRLARRLDEHLPNSSDE
jgi:peroxidase